MRVSMKLGILHFAEVNLTMPLMSLITILFLMWAF